MTTILLTGAGFSHNWGAWLAYEAFEYLLSCPELDQYARQELWNEKNKGLGFEATLARLQEGAPRDASGKVQKQVHTLQTALAGMFNLMDQGLQRRQFEFQSDMRFQVGPFLTQFDAVFTLNQDLLLERHYHRGVLLLGDRRWAGAMSPGIAPPYSANIQDPTLLIGERRSPAHETQFRLAPNFQPYFKLHGSSNWYDADGGRMLVMGGNKTKAIGSSPLLKWYADQFDQFLQRGNTKLMVIGYGFGDPHINQALIDAAPTGLQLFIIDPGGTDVLDKRPRIPLRALTDPLMDALQPAIIGASRRPLTAIFGGDLVEHSRVMGFF